jgi:hypothetical protein
MNYVKHMNQWMELVTIDDRLTPHHISIYLALFQQWNKSRFPDSILICRNEIMQAAKVGSTKTYYNCLHALHEFGYIVYTPSNCPITGSRVSVNLLFESSGEDENDDEKEDSDPLCSPINTQVLHRQNKLMSGGKSATTENPQVTTLLKHYKNLINSKQRERRAHEKKISCSNFFNKKLQPMEQSGFAAGERKKEGTAMQSRKPASLPALRPVSTLKKELARNFAAPTLDELKAFFAAMRIVLPSGNVCDRAALELEAQKFFDHFESNGWLVGGKSPMRNWKAACRSWAAKIPYFNRKPAGTSFRAVRPRKNFHVELVKNYAQPL